MGITDKIFGPPYRDQKVDPDTLEELYRTFDSDEGYLLEMRPHEEGEGIAGGLSLMENLYDFRKDMGFVRTKNKSHVNGWEIWYDEEIKFILYAPNERLKDWYKNQIETHYPRSLSEVYSTSEKEEKYLTENVLDDLDVEIEEDYKTHRERLKKSLDWKLPIFEKDDFVAGATFKLRQELGYPIKNVKGAESFEEDPLKSLITDLVVDDDDKIILQILFKPADPSWVNGDPFPSMIGGTTPVGKLAQRARKADVSGEIYLERTDPSQAELEYADEIKNQKNKNAYIVNINLVCFSPRDGEASDTVERLSKDLENRFKAVKGQTFNPKPKSGDELKELVKRMAKREIKQEKFDNKTPILTFPEVVCLAHLPNGSVKSNKINWRTGKKGGRLPSGTKKMSTIQRNQEESSHPSEPRDIENASSEDKDNFTRSEDSIEDSTSEDPFSQHGEDSSKNEFETTNGVDTIWDDDTFEDDVESNDPFTDDIGGKDGFDQEPKDNSSEEHSFENSPSSYSEDKQKDTLDNDPFSSTSSSSTPENKHHQKNGDRDNQSSISESSSEVETHPDELDVEDLNADNIANYSIEELKEAGLTLEEINDILE